MNLKPHTFGDIAEIIKDTYQPSVSEDVSYIGLEHIEQQTLRLSSIGRSLSVTSNKFKFKAGDILFGKLRPYFRKVYRPKFDGICSTDIWVIRAKKKFDQGFMFYFIANKDFIDLASQGSSGTRMPRADWNNLKNREWDFPDPPTQTRIASILSSLDDKIELNHRMNQTLEKIAETLFKKYFVDDIDPDNLPEGWRLNKVSEQFNINIGRTPPRVQREWFTNDANDVKWVSIKDMGSSGVYIFNTSEYLTKEAVKKFNVPVIPRDTVILSFKLTVGRVSITTCDMLSNEAIAHFNPKESCYLSPYYTYMILKNFDYDSLGNTSSIATAVNSQTVKGMKLKVPTKEQLNKYSETVKPIFGLIRKSLEETETLKTIRDTLLPKFMSGEIDLSTIHQNSHLHAEVLS